MARHTGLGRGLDALIPDRTKKAAEKASEKAIEKAAETAKEKSARKTTAAKKSGKEKEKTNSEKKGDSEAAKIKAAGSKAADLKTAGSKAAGSKVADSRAVDSEAADSENTDSFSETPENEPASTSAETEGQPVSSGDRPAGGTENEPVSGFETMLRITLVEPNRSQPRKVFQEEPLKELADSIQKFGIIQPLLVQKKDGYYEIIAGERRWRAAKMAGLKEVPVIIKDFTNKQAVEISLIENIQREDLNPIEEARAYKRLIDEFSLSQESVADRVSKSRTTVTNSMRLLKLGEKVQDMLTDGVISEGHARALLAVPDPELQEKLAERIVKEHLNVRQIEKIVHDLTVPAKRSAKKKDPQMEAVYRSISEQLKGILGTKVEINQVGKNKGRIEIEYYSEEELERIYDLLRSIEGAAE
jgi:ParB family chromosome partitioning protein